jgi:hypothetical protein
MANFCDDDCQSKKFHNKWEFRDYRLCGRRPSSNILKEHNILETDL